MLQTRPARLAAPPLAVLPCNIPHSQQAISLGDNGARLAEWLEDRGLTKAR